MNDLFNFPSFKSSELNLILYLYINEIGITIISKNPKVEEKYFIKDCIFFIKIAKVTQGRATSKEIIKLVNIPFHPN